MTPRTIALTVVVIGIVGAIAYLEYGKAPRVELGSSSPVIPLAAPTGTPADERVASPGASSSSARATSFRLAEKIKRYPRAIELVNPSGFLNTEPFKIAGLIGTKVILVDFWTYSCINCQRTLPYLTSWYDTYKDKGFEIIGVHTPEFGFEKVRDNVAMAISKYGIKYPVVQDNDYGTWSAYQNQYWPHEYLIDIDGFIVEDHIGEGGYDATERKIQELLAERMARFDIEGSVQGGISHPTSAIAIDTSKLASPETYFGAARNQFLANGTAGTTGEQTLAEPADKAPNKLYLAGTWNFDREFAENRSAKAKIIFRYTAKNVYLVASSDAGVELTILRDGKPLGTARGADVNASTGTVQVRESRLYKLIEDPAGYGEHTIEIMIDTPGLKAFTFTFG